MTSEQGEVPIVTLDEETIDRLARSIARALVNTVVHTIAAVPPAYFELQRHRFDERQREHDGLVDCLIDRPTPCY